MMVRTLLVLLSLAVFTPSFPLADDRIHGYWFLSGRDGFPDFARTDTLHALHPDGRLAILPRALSADAESIAFMDVEIQGNIAVFTSSEVLYDSEYYYEPLNADLIHFVNMKGEFFLRRMPEDAHLHAALLRLALTGEVARYQPAVTDDFFGDAERVVVDLKDDNGRLLLVHMPNARLEGAIEIDEAPWGRPLGPNVMAFWLTPGSAPAKVTRLLSEASRPLLPEDE
ncbi:hypothetical protein [Fodinicurvata fenggangensis]|uniref:hypothetical protein n=1 Tax=Fodinicurvata fenggangensis TaxID=1121830 RepID=UPI00047CAA99|nr:hypothetical protein [Fodinicurvata fenggangensis]